MIWRWKDWGPTKVTTVTRGPVLEAKRGRRLVFGWNNPPTTVTLDFERHADGTIVRLRDSGYPDIPQGRRDLLECASGGG